MVSALYIDQKGPYPKMEDVDCWDESRDAKLYAGPHPVVAHPRCGPWSRLAHFSKLQDPTCAPRALEQVRAYGGVLEHPEGSRLWKAFGLSMPWGGMDEFGGFTVAVDQVGWGHRCRKRTWLYFVGVPRWLVEESMAKTMDPLAVPTHAVDGGPREKGKLPGISHAGRRRTPPAFAEWLVSLARQAR